MGKPLQRPFQFRRNRRQLPGQSSDEELGLGLTVRYIDRPGQTIINKDLVIVGNVDVGRYIQIDSDGLKFYVNNEVVISMKANGDMIFGDADEVNANLLWDLSEGQLKFRGGTTTEIYIDTDGSLVAGDGDVILNSDGITLNQGDTDTEKIKVIDGGTSIVEIYGFTDDGASSQLIMVGPGKGDEGVDTPEGAVHITAITHDGTVNGGAASVNISLTTNNDRVTISAGETRILGDLEVVGASVFNELSQDKDFRIEGANATHLFFVDAADDNVGLRSSAPHTSCILDLGGANVSRALRLPRLTTTERNFLSPSEGMIIYNTTDDKFQGYNGAWVDLH